MTYAATTLTVPTSTGGGTASAFSGGWASIVCYGNFTGGGAVKLQVSYDGEVTWLDTIDSLGNAISFTANGLKEVVFGGTPQVRAYTTGSIASVAMSIEYGQAIVSDQEQ